ncbi:adenylosuccinate synthase [Mycolicibacterium sp.]|uniref:adenylosuccinate synthase n=1 Tax=Mycolicibacterium sp. TaxID=2320850 RepID=UPI0037C8CE02
MAAPRKRTTAKKAATEARKAEAGDGFVTIEHCGLQLRIPVGDNVPLDLMEEIDAPEPESPTEADERRRDIALTKALLGPEQWTAFKATQPTWRDYRELGTKISEISGN